MFRTINILTLLLVLLAGSQGSSWAESMKIKYIASIYRDMEGRGLNRPQGVTCNNTGSEIVVADSGNDRLVRYSFENDTLSGGATIRPEGLSNPLTVRLNSKGEILVLDGQHLALMRLDPEGKAAVSIEPKGIPAPSRVVPKSVAVDGDDRIYVLDIAGWRVIQLEPGGSFLKSFPIPAKVGFPGDLTVDPLGRILILDSGGGAVYAIQKETGDSTLLNGNLETYINWPKGITTDSRGIIYISDQHGGALSVLGQDGVFQGSHLGPGWKESLLEYPSQVCINGKGELFVADRENSRVQVFRLVIP